MNTHLPPLPSGAPEPQTDAPLPPLPEIPLPPPEEPPAPPIPIHGQKKQLHWLIPAAAVVVLAAGASFCLYTEKQALAEQTDHLESHAESLKKDAAALSEQIALLRQKQEEAQKRRILKEEETARLLETLQKKEKETEQLRLEYGAVHTEQDAVRKRIEVLEQELTQITSDEDKGNRGPEGTDIPPVINPPGQETDARLLKAGIDYLKARKLGNASALSEHFAPYCSYQYANNREVPKETVMNDVREGWKKYPRRAYRLLKVAYLGKRVEIIYWYEYVNQKKRTVRGYAREKWEINSIGQIVHWREDTHLQTPPQESPGYRLVPLNIK
ncbi:MAG: DUF1348 family protein [Akkermansiaceae bacterium]|nr:DUF1348 family protein [Akkermansiaceae bacterium]